MLRALWVKILAQRNFSLVCGCYHNLILFEAYGKQPEMACFSDRIFSTPFVVYREVLVFRLERATEVLELTYLGKYFACVNAN